MKGRLVMAYLGLNKHGEDNGLYSFTSISMRDKVGSKLSGSLYYDEKDRKRAIEEIGITEAEIKDGGILIRKYVYEVLYLGIKDTSCAGVYSFKTEGLCDSVAKHFVDPIKTTDKLAIMQEFNLSSDAEIQDGGIFLSSEMRRKLEMMMPSSTSVKVIGDSKEKESRKSGESVSKTSDQNIQTNSDSKAIFKNVNSFKTILNIYQNQYDIAEVTMNNGEVYRVTLRTIFYVTDEKALQNCGYIGENAKPQIKDSVIEKMLDQGKLLILPKSYITYYDGCVRIQNCDDAYSPTISTDEFARQVIFHSIEDVMINTNLYVSIVGKDSFQEIGYKKIDAQSNKVLYDYLVNKYVRNRKEK